MTAIAAIEDATMMSTITVAPFFVELDCVEDSFVEVGEGSEEAVNVTCWDLLTLLEVCGALEELMSWESGEGDADSCDVASLFVAFTDPDTEGPPELDEDVAVGFWEVPVFDGEDEAEEGTEGVEDVLAEEVAGVGVGDDEVPPPRTGTN